MKKHRSLVALKRHTKLSVERQKTFFLKHLFDLFRGKE